MKPVRKPPPYSTTFHVTGLPIAFLFIGSPDCWQHCQKEQNKGFFNHLALADIADNSQYNWSLVSGLEMIVIHFGKETAEQLQRVVAELFSAGAKSVDVRDFHDPHQRVVSFSYAATAQLRYSNV